MTDSAAPSSPVVFARQRSASPQSSIVIDISAPLDDPPAATTITPSTTLDPEGEDLDKTAVAIGGDADGNESAEKLTEMGTDAKTEEPTTPPLRNSAVSMRVLGVNYFPPVKEEEETVHPLRLDISPPSPRDWEQGGDLVDEDVGEWNLKAEPGRPMSFRHQQEISAVRRTRPPVSAYPFGPPPPDAAFGTDPVGRLGVHHPREIVRVERDYSGGEIVQFVPAYPLEFEGRVSPTQFLETINSFNEILISAYSLRHGFVDNVLDILTLHVSKLLMSTHYDREMKRLRREMDRLNEEIYNPAGLNILWPRRVGFLFLEIEYY